MKVCVYTAICGGYDDLKEQPEQTIPCDFVCFTDDPGGPVPAPWRLAPLDAPADLAASSRLRAKRPKIVPHLAFGATGLEAYDVTIWIDASVRILRPDFAQRLIACMDGAGLAVVPHPERDCIYQEVEACLQPATAHRHVAERIREQVAHYRQLGYPEHHGLFAGGVIARDMHNTGVRELDAAWWDQNLRWSPADQLSLPYVRWMLGAGIGLFDVNLWRNPWFEVWPHLDPIGQDLHRRARAEYAATAWPMPADADRFARYRPGRGEWHVDGMEAMQFGHAEGGLLPLLGDWDGDGEDAPGLYDPRTGTFFLGRERSDGSARHMFSFGPAGAIPVAGDWDGDGRDSVGVFIPDTGTWALLNRHQSGSADLEFQFGVAGTTMLPVAGDWTGQGRDGIGLYEPAHSSWFVATELKSGARAEFFEFGPPGGAPIIGDWNGDGIDEVGVFIAEQGQAFLALANRASSPAWRARLDAADGMPVVYSRRRGRCTKEQRAG